MTKSPNAGNRVWMARESWLRSGSSQMVGTIGRPAFSRSRRYVLSMFQPTTEAGFSSVLVRSTRRVQSANCAGRSV